MFFLLELCVCVLEVHRFTASTNNDGSLIPSADLGITCAVYVCVQCVRNQDSIDHYSQLCARTLNFMYMYVCVHNYAFNDSN